MLLTPTLLVMTFLRSDDKICNQFGPRSGPTFCHLEYLSLKKDAQARLSLHFTKCHIVGNLMSRLNYNDASVVSLISWLAK